VPRIYKPIEDAHGTGNVYRVDDTLVQRARYALRADHGWRANVEPDVFQRGMTRITGHVYLDVDVAADYALRSDVLTLQLDDGRWFDFQMASADGRILAKSPLREDR
jgi:hypothetical protein